MKKETSHWAQIYQTDINKKGGNLPYILRKIEKKQKLVNLVRKYVDTEGNKTNSIIECGSGTAAVSIHLSTLGYNVTAIDIEEEVLKLSHQLAEDYFATLEENKGKITFEKKSIFELDYKENTFDVAFSNGVLEHFNDDEIIEIIKQQLFVAKTTIVGIPTKYFESKEAKYGNERVLELSYWRKLINTAGGKIIEEIGMDREPFRKRIVNFKKYFKPKPYHLFVVKNTK